MKHRRTILKVLLLLIAGATLNVAVAWGCAAWVDLTVAESQKVSPGIPGQYWVHTKYVRLGISAFLADGETMPDLRDNASAGAESFFPAWSSLSAQSADSLRLNRWRESRRYVATGWPLHALWYQSDRLLYEPHKVPIITERVKGGIPLRLHEWALGRADFNRALPLRPIWPGFAINTVFYAGVLWVLCCGPFALRRMIRRRRGQCPACAYPIGQSPVCTECGNFVRGN